LHAKSYAIPREYHQIKRYGFHGSSHSYLTKQAAKILKKQKPNLITLHLGNGSSICAIKEAKSIDTSMGFTPLEGLIMGTRCGDIDAGVIFYMAKELKLDIDDIEMILTKKSGLKGISKKSDLREILKSDDEFSKLSIEMMVYRIKKYIGSYLAILDSVDAIIFSGGIGENSPVIREKVLKGLEKFGILTDFLANKKNNTIISQEKSPIKVFVIKTNEEKEIYLRAKEALNG
jgi:acetate kinase